uniref:Putative structural protein n=1 Tax=viral metagenome TaxID=1070528 RepID=A0A6M3J4P9_9ZZZZ
MVMTRIKPPSEIDWILEQSRKFREHAKATTLKGILETHFDVKPDEPFYLTETQGKAFGYDIQPGWKLKYTYGETDTGSTYNPSWVNPEGWQITSAEDDENKFLSPEGEEFTLPDLEALDEPAKSASGLFKPVEVQGDYGEEMFPYTPPDVTPPQGFVWDYDTGEFISSTAEMIKEREDLYSQFPEIAPPGTPGKMTPDEWNVIVVEQQAKQAELVSTFRAVIPDMFEPIPEEQHFDVIREVVNSLATPEGENEEIKDWFVETVLDIGRTPQTESLLKELGYDVFGIGEFFGEPSPTEQPITGEVITGEAPLPPAPGDLSEQLHSTGIPISLYDSLSEGQKAGLRKPGEYVEIRSVNGERKAFAAGTPKTGYQRLDEWVVGTANAPLFNIGGVGISVSDMAGIGLLALGVYEGSKSIVPLFSAVKDKVLQTSLNAGMDKWIAQRSRGVPAQKFKVVQDFLYNVIAKNRTWLQQKATENMLSRMGRGVNQAQAAKQAVEQVIKDVEGSLLPSLTVTNTAVPGQKMSMSEILTGLTGKTPATVSAVQAGRMELAKEPWQMTNKEYQASIISRTRPDVSEEEMKRIVSSIPDRLTETEHKGIIQEALSEGKPVPTEVLKDYPDLKPTAPKPITPEVTVDEVIRRYEVIQKEARAEIKYGIDIAKATEAEYVKAGLAQYRKEAKEIGFSLDIKKQTQFLREEYSKLAIPKAEVTPTEAPKAAPGMPEAIKPVATGIVEPVKVPVKAANIRLEKYPEEVRPLIQEWADTHGAEVEKATRGIVSDAQVKAEAERLTTEVGGDLSKLRRKWKPATAWNAEELVAIRSVLRAKTQSVLSAQKLVKDNNSSQNLLKLELALKEQAAVQEMVHGLTAEAGRALRSFRQEAFDALNSNDVSRMEELLNKLRGNRENTEKIAEMLGRLDPTDPIAVNKFIQELYKPHVMDYLIELFYNSILSGPKTHIVNSLSNTANAIFSPIERALSAAIDLPLSWIQGRQRERFLSEVPADIFGAVRGIPEGFRQFAYVIKNGISFDQATKWEFRQKAFKGKLGAAIGMPSRFLEGADMLMKTINQRAALNAEAHRIASKEKLSGEKFEDRVADLLASPTEDMLKEANRVAEYRLFRQAPGKFGQTLMNLRDAVSVFGIKPLRFVIPFIRTPLNLVKFGLERTPLGFLNPKLWENVAQKNPEAADQIARATIGAIGLASLTWYFAAGMITGAPPRDRAARDRFYREGKQPYAIRVGDFWVSYQRLEPFNQLLGMVAILSDSIENNDKGTLEKIADAVNTFGQNFISQTYMSSVSDLLNMLGEPERYAGKWLDRFAASMAVPMSSATRTAAMMFDQTVRDPETAWETIEASIPGLSTKVKAKLSTLGEEIERKSPPWFPINVTPVEETVLSQELERLEFDIGFAGGSISGIELSDDEQREYQILSGKLIKDDLKKLMVTPEYWQATDAEKDKMLRKVVDAARNWSRSEMRQNIWTKGTNEDRVKVLETAISESDKQLGKIISEVETFTHEPPNIYDISHELDSSYRALLQDIPESATKGMDLPPSLHSWYVKEEAAKTSGSLPNVKLIDINADTTIGKSTFEDYYDQWQERGKITDARELEAFDVKYPKANLGNISRRQLELLKDYHKLDKPGQEKFLDGLSEVDRNSLTTNAYTDWLKANSKDNAQLAIWGQAKILTKDAYNEYNRLIRELDIVDSALPKLTLPPETSIDTHFTYEQMVLEGKQGSWEGQKLLRDDDLKAKEAGVDSYVDWRRKEGSPLELSDTPMASLEIKITPEYREIYDKIGNLSDRDSPDYIPDEKARAEAIKKIKTDNPEWVDNNRRIEAIEKGTDDNPVDKGLIDAHVEFMRMQDVEGVGSSTAEVMLYRTDNSGYNAFRMDDSIWGNKALLPIDESKIPTWRIDAKYRQQAVEYDAIDPDTKNPETGIRLRDEWLQLPENEEYRLDRRRKDAYTLTNSKTGYKFPVEMVEEYVVYSEYGGKGKRQERFLVENLTFAQALHDAGQLADIPLPKDVPAVQFDDIYDQYAEQFDRLEGAGKQESIYFIPDKDERIQTTYDLRFDKNGKLTPFGKAEVRRTGYKDFVPEKYIERYTEWGTINKEGIPTDWPKDGQGNNLTWYEDDWYLIDHPNFYNDVYVTLLEYSPAEKRDKDAQLAKVPTPKVFNLYARYVKLVEGKPREDLRFNNHDLDDWLLLTGKVTTSISEKIRRSKLTPSEKAREGLKEIEELLK